MKRFDFLWPYAFHAPEVVDRLEGTVGFPEFDNALGQAMADSWDHVKVFNTGLIQLDRNTQDQPFSITHGSDDELGALGARPLKLYAHTCVKGIAWRV